MIQLTDTEKRRLGVDEEVVAAAWKMVSKVRWAITAYRKPFTEPGQSWWFATKAEALSFKRDMAELHRASGREIHWNLSEVQVQTPATWVKKWAAAYGDPPPPEAAVLAKRSLEWLETYEPRAVDPVEAEELGLAPGSVIRRKVQE